MIAFIDGQRGVHRVEPICEVLPITPSTHHAHTAQRINSTRCSPWAQRDGALMPLIERGTVLEGQQIVGTLDADRAYLHGELVHEVDCASLENPFFGETNAPLGTCQPLTPNANF